jgi:hypothetical protein
VEILRSRTLLTLLERVSGALVAAQDSDGYLHTLSGHDGRARYANFEFGHELYCMGHFIEAAVTRQEEDGRSDLMDAARRLVDHNGDEFGPGRREEVDPRTELELALCRMAAASGDDSLVALAAWMLAQPLCRSPGAIRRARAATRRRSRARPLTAAP